MQKIKCIITDDEPIARQIIHSYCLQLPFLEVVVECENAIETLSFLTENKADILFLDINMPVLSGLSLLNTLTQKPKVILTTAYKEYALEAFELEVSDYLLKPFSFERFLKAVQKTQSQMVSQNSIVIQYPHTNNKNLSVSETFDGIFLQVSKTIYRFAFSDILFCEAQQNYTRIVTTEQEVRIYKPISHIKKQLPTTLFLQTHRSYIVK